MPIDIKYFKEYREKLGFSNQLGVKDFFSAKDIKPLVDYNYIKLLNLRLIEIVRKLDELVAASIKVRDINSFCIENIEDVYSKLYANNIFVRLNNQGRRPEGVYFSWMRGFVVASYFLKAISEIFEINIKDIKLIGDDTLKNIDTFKRTPKADLQVVLKSGEMLRLEVQSGFQGINDIKQHKVIEAKRIKRTEGISTVAIHFDLYNGQVAFIKLDKIDDNSMHWITRPQMEGQLVFNIEQNYFIWRLIDAPPKYMDLLFS